MKKDNTQWIDILKEKVDSYEGEKPAASWEDMRDRMLAADRRVNMRKWWVTAAAACLTALVAGGIFLNQKQNAALPEESFADADEKIEVVTSNQTAAPAELLAEVPEENAQIAGAHSGAAKTAGSPVEMPSDAVSEPSAQAGPSDAAGSSDSAEPGQETDSEETSAEDNAESVTNDAAVKQQGKTSQFAFAEPQKKQRGGRFSIGVNGQFGNGDANNSKLASYSQAPHVPSVPKDNPYGSLTFAMAVARTEYHHAAPISFGVSFRYDMPSGIYAESGLRFTQFLTTVTPSGAKQALLYAGVPVGLGYNLFSNDNIGVYASGYYMPAKCIAGRESTNYPTNSTNRNDIPLQHSAGISAGADYTVWNMISIYAEPTLSYYFKSENAPVTIFTENPFYFTLNVGARFNF